MFWKKTTLPVSKPTIAEADSAVLILSSGSGTTSIPPSPSNYSLASSLYSSNQGFLDRRTQQNTPPPSPDFTLVHELTRQVMKLQDQRDELEGLYNANRLTIDQLYADIQGKEEECKELKGKVQEREDLHTPIRELNAELTYLQQLNQATVEMLSDIQDKFDVVGTSEKECKCSLLQQQEDITIIREQVQDFRCTTNTDVTETAMVEKSLKDDQGQTADLQRLIKENSAELHKSSNTHNQALRTRDQQLASQAKQINVLQPKNDILASHVAISNTNANKLNRLTHAFQHHHYTLSASHAKQQQNQNDLRAQLDATYTQYQHDRARLEIQIHTKDAALQTLSARLQQSEDAAAKLVLSHDDEISSLQDRLRRLGLDRDDEKARAEAWAEYANGR